MDAPAKPTSNLFAWIKREVQPRTEEQLGPERSEAPLNDREVESLRQIVNDDYEKLVTVLGLTPVPLDVYSYSASSDAKTRFGTSLTNCTPLYDLYKIVLPLHPSTVRDEGIADMQCPPACWNMFSTAWPKWRIDLWHEVLHQVEDQIYDTWEGGEIHGPSYIRAIFYAAEKLKPICLRNAVVTPAQLRVLVLGEHIR
jgi:hypothetical protein